MRALLPHIQTAITALLIMYLSLAEQVGDARRLYRVTPHADKIAHFVMYFALTMVLIMSYRRFISGRRHAILLACGVFFYGVLMEVLQKYVTTSRHFDYWDMVANLTGIIAALIFIQIVSRYFPPGPISRR